MRRLSSTKTTPRTLSTRDTVINWGLGSIPARFTDGGCQWLNKFPNVTVAGNKLLSFRELSNNPNIRIPEFTEDRQRAEHWINEGGWAVCRTVLRGHSGQGIVLAKTVDELVPAPLYVRYLKKIKEFRVHVFKGGIIDIQQKRIRSGAEEGQVNHQIRNAHTGWVYCREGIEEPADLGTQAVLSVQQLGLDFGAVDLIYNSHLNQCHVLEVNTAPGLEGTTLVSYTNAFLNEVRS